MRTVLVNVTFRDRYTDEVYVAGKTYPMSEERISEVKEVNPNFITVISTPKVEVPEVEVPEVEVPEVEAAEKETAKKSSKK